MRHVVRACAVVGVSAMCHVGLRRWQPRPMVPLDGWRNLGTPDSPGWREVWRAGRAGPAGPARTGAGGAPRPRRSRPAAEHSGLDQSVRVEHELLGRALVEVLVTLRGFV